MKKMFIALLTVAWLLSGCVSEGNKTQIGNEESIKIGAIMMLTGGGAEQGIPSRRGVEIAVQKINNEGGINGKQLEVLFEDEKTDAQDAATAMQKLISEDGVQVVIGPTKSSAVLAAAPIAEENKVVLLTPQATSPKVSDAGAFVFRSCSRIDVQAETLAQEAIKRGFKRVAILFSNEPYGQGSADMFKQKFAALGGEIVAEESFMRNDRDFSAQLTKIKATGPDALFIPGYDVETAPASVQARQLGLDQHLFGVYGSMSPQFLELGGEAVEGTFLASEFDPSSTDPRAQEFVTLWEEWVAAHPDDPDNIMFAATTFEATMLVAEAMREQGTSAEDVRTFFDALEGIESISGEVSFDDNGDRIRDEVILLEVHGGQFVAV
jgi:branched-chain amino acid transport system substrate-binding protein